jgi:hypothetical protein
MTEPATTPAEAFAQIEAMRADTAHPLHYGDAAALETHRRLTMIAYSDPAAQATPAPIPAGLTSAQLDERIEANRAAFDRVDNGSPAWRRLEAEREALLHARHSSSTQVTSAPADALVTVTESDAAKVADVLAARGQGDEYDVPTVEAEYGTVRQMLGQESADRYVAGGLLVIAGARAEIARRGKPDLVATENLLDSEWGSDADAKWAAADLAWSRLTPRTRADLTREGVNLHPSFLRFLADVGTELFRTKAGEEFLLARHKEPVD